MRSLILCIALALSMSAQGIVAADSLGVSCPVVEMEVERLADLNIPRTGHATVVVGGEVVVIGGHTSGFVPTPTAERYSDGAWQVMPMVYAHDQGLVVPLRSGRVLIAGGHEQPLGIGQTFALELYDPASHTFEGYGCLDRKRVFAEGAELDSGQVVISGNWYEGDGIELFNGGRQCQRVSDVTQQRTKPYVLRTAADDAIIFGCLDIHGQPLDTIIVDRLRGERFSPPLLQTWRPCHIYTQHHSYNNFIGDETAGCYDYLISTENDSGERTLMRITGNRLEGAVFSLLPLSVPIPQVYDGDSISYPSDVIADRRTQRAFLVGKGTSSRFYVVEFHYAPALEGSPAPMTLYVSQPMPGAGYSQPVLTPQGDIIIAGGTTTEGNFTPRTSVFLFRMAEDLVAVSETNDNTVALIIGLIVVVVIVALTSLLLVRRRKAQVQPPVQTCSPAPSSTINPQPSSPVVATSIADIIRSRRLFCRSTLKLADLAADLDMPARAISEAVKEETGITVTQFINTCRIDYAKQLLLQRPAMKLSDLAAEVGFANESTFYRTFKAITGLTPKDWLAGNDVK